MKTKITKPVNSRLNSHFHSVAHTFENHTSNLRRSRTTSMERNISKNLLRASEIYGISSLSKSTIEERFEL